MADGQQATNHTLASLIEADRYLKSIAAATGGVNRRGGPRSAWGAVRMAKAVPPGAAGLADAGATWE